MKNKSHRKIEVKPGLTIDEAYASLAGAICAKAYQDLVLGLRWHGEKDITVKQIEKFFRGEWFAFLTDGKVDGEMVIQEAHKCRKLRHI